MAYCDSPKMLTKIDYITLFPNPEELGYNTCLMVFRDGNNEKFFGYSEKVRKEINISIIEQNVSTWYMIDRKKDFNLEFKMMPVGDEQVCFSIISLDVPKSEIKEMTMSEIEKKLGHKVKIKNG